MKRFHVYFLFLNVITWVLPVAAGERRDSLAQWIVKETGVRKGICLDLGCGDAALAVKLAAVTELKIQCLDWDAKVVEKARRMSDAAGVYGARVSVDRSSFSPLLYPTYCANLIICGDEFAGGKRKRDFKELFRVLNPNGVALIGQSAAASKKGHKLTKAELEGWLKAAGITSYKIIEKDGIWVRITRQRISGWDEWTHRNHDPANTFGSRDTTITNVDFRLNWAVEPPVGLGASSVLFAGGRQFIACATIRNAKATPSIHAFDAFNGMLLWERVGKKAVGFDRSLANYHSQRPCSDIVATRDFLYILGGANCYLLNAATGKTTHTWPLPPEADSKSSDIWQYLSIVGDTVYGGGGAPPKAGYYSSERGIMKAFFSLDRSSGKLRQMKKSPMITSSIAIGEGKIFYCDPELRLHAIDAKTLEDCWGESRARLSFKDQAQAR